MAALLAPASLVLLAQAGDRSALEELFKAVQGPLHGYLAGLVADAHLADDVLQEVFVLLWRKRSWLRDPELVRPWLYRIASREAFRRLRRERSWPGSLAQPEPELVAEEAVYEPALPGWLERLPQHLAALPPASRAVLVLRYQQGMTLEEAATVLELSLGTVKSRLASGLALLRRRLAPEEADDGRQGRPAAGRRPRRPGGPGVPRDRRRRDPSHDPIEEENRETRD
ncbi:MAG: RNA polymerase sigma factor [Gemmataceae bacterium]|nr:RNA polymerase sigma factor [Gemmataceae bacterium]